MVEKGTVHQHVLTGELSLLLFIDEYINPWSSLFRPNLELLYKKAPSEIQPQFNRNTFCLILLLLAVYCSLFIRTVEKSAPRVPKPHTGLFSRVHIFNEIPVILCYYYWGNLMSKRLWSSEFFSSYICKSVHTMGWKLMKLHWSLTKYYEQIYFSTLL